MLRSAQHDIFIVRCSFRYCYGMRVKPPLQALIKMYVYFVGNGPAHSAYRFTSGSGLTQRNGQDRSLRGDFYILRVFVTACISLQAEQAGLFPTNMFYILRIIVTAQIILTLEIAASLTLLAMTNLRYSALQITTIKTKDLSFRAQRGNLRSYQ